MNKAKLLLLFITSGLIIQLVVADNHESQTSLADSEEVDNSSDKD